MAASNRLSTDVAPSGKLKATLAMHLHRLSFHIADMRSEEFLDESSPSFKKLQLIPR